MYGVNMNFDELVYPEIIYIGEQEYKAKRDMSKGTVSIPYTDEPDVGIGDVITQKSGKREIALKVLDASFLKNGTLNVGTRHPHIVKLKVENTTAKAHKEPAQQSTINIGSVTGEQVQVGNNNTQTVNISIQQLVEEIAKTNDPEAKGLLKKLLENSTVGSLIGVGASALIGLL
jgi:sRNA-binding carbon storage regulator CsrA